MEERKGRYMDITTRPQPQSMCPFWFQYRHSHAGEKFLQPTWKAHGLQGTWCHNSHTDAWHPLTFPHGAESLFQAKSYWLAITEMGWAASHSCPLYTLSLALSSTKEVPGWLHNLFASSCFPPAQGWCQTWQ